jgi:hypothetical protein
MIVDQELARAVEGRPHWRAGGEQVAVFQPPGAAGYVQVRRIAQPVKASQRYVVSTIQGGRAIHVLPAGTAVEGVRLAERNPPT